MKKFLLMAAIAAGTMTANAQMKLDQSKIKMASKVELASEVQDNTTRAMQVVNMYYYRPQGLFYSGWNKGYFNPGVSFAPIETNLHFEANYESGTPAWAYPSGNIGSDGEPEAAEYQGESIDLNLKAGKYFTPMLVNLEDQQNDRFTPVGYMNVGGATFQGIEEYEGEEVCNDGYAVNYVPTGNIALLPQYLCTANPDADAQFQQVIGDNTYKTRGFGELFTSPAKMTVRGFNMLVYAEENIMNSLNKVKASFIELIPGQGVNEIKGYKDFDVEITEVEAPNQGFGIYHLLYTLKGDPITVDAEKLLIPMVTTTKIQMSPLFDGQPRWDETVEQSQGITTMFLCAETADGEVYTQVPSLAVTSQAGDKVYLNNWCIGLDMSYAADGGFAGIDNVVADEVAGNAAVYTVEGVKVSNGDVENLPAGVYVKGGKKFVVR